MTPTSVESGLLFVNLAEDGGIVEKFEQVAADRSEALAADQASQTMCLQCSQRVLKT